MRPLVVGLDDADGVDGVLLQAPFRAPYRGGLVQQPVVAFGVAVACPRLGEHLVGDVERDAPVGADDRREPMNGLVRFFGEEAEADRCRHLAVGGVIRRVGQRGASQQAFVFYVGHEAVEYHGFQLLYLSMR